MGTARLGSDGGQELDIVLQERPVCYNREISTEGRRIVSRPQVVTCSTASLDGRLAVSPEVLLLWGDERWPAADESGSLFAWLRATYQPQATLEGSGSFVRLADEPAPLPPFAGDAAALYQDFLPEAVVRRPGHRGWFTAVDGRGRVREWIKDGAVFGEEFVGWHLLVLVAHQTPAAYLAYLQREQIPYLVAGQERVDLPLALDKLGAKLGVTRLLSTAGGKLNGALLRAGLVDEINVEFLPAIVGGFHTPALFDAPDLKPDEWPVRLTLLSSQVHDDGRVWLRYQVAAE
jgi:2,5-diamino-6-(ribosylamino)-4(3H)-pyrimidinone 5'-phosphate reductase